MTHMEKFDKVGNLYGGEELGRVRLETEQGWALADFSADKLCQAVVQGGDECVLVGEPCIPTPCIKRKYNHRFNLMFKRKYSRRAQHQAGIEGERVETGAQQFAKW